MLPNDLFIPLSLGEIFKRMFDVFNARMDTFLILSLIVFIPSAIAMATLVNRTPDIPTDDAADIDDDTLRETQAWISKLAFEGSVVFIISILGKASISRAVGEIYIGVGADWHSCLKAGIGRFMTLICTVILVAHLSYISFAIVGTIAVIIAASESTPARIVAAIIAIAAVAVIIYMLIPMCIFIPVAMTEGTGPFDSLKRVYAVAENNRLAILCPNLAFGFVASLVQQIFTAIVLSGNTNPPWYLTVINFLPSIFIVPLESILETVIYFSLRVQNEGFNQEALEANLGLRSPMKEDVESSFTRQVDDKA